MLNRPMINSTTANMRVERHNTRTPSLLAAAIAKVAAHPTANCVHDAIVNAENISTRNPMTFARGSSREMTE